MNIFRDIFYGKFSWKSLQQRDTRGTTRRVVDLHYWWVYQVVILCCGSSKKGIGYIYSFRDDRNLGVLSVFFRANRRSIVKLYVNAQRRQGFLWETKHWDSSRALRHLSLQWRHNGSDGFSNRQHVDGLLNRLFRRRSKKTLKLHVTGLWEGSSPVTGEFPSQSASKAKNVSIWWRHYVP